MLALPGSNETAGEVAGSCTDVLTFKLPDTYWNDYVGEVNAATWLIVGDLAQIEDGVRKLNIGEVKVLDPDGKILG